MKAPLGTKWNGVTSMGVTEVIQKKNIISRKREDYSRVIDLSPMP
jgi:hypothetical protein